ncbi:hypothetical protein IQ250_27910, partial [Pseudanabaenaceae cyanobacterium LEGE 13415]|nr:hypothetical protein [Pseudanabaenaceae cyanobacterium LEGE 13415]
MKSLQKLSATIGLTMLCALSLSSCANSPLAGSLKDSLAADPRLTGTASPQTSPQQTAQLPPTFPAEVPRYPNATLLEARSTSNTPVEQSTDLFTRWSTVDDRDRIFNFYRDELQKNGWTLNEQNAEQGRLIASRQRLKVGIGVAAAQTGANFSIETQAESQAAQPSSPS